MPFRNGLLLPGARQTETISWRLSATGDPALFTIKSPNGLALGLLTRTE